MRRFAALGVGLVCVMILTSCSFLSGFFGPRVDDAQVVRDTMAHLIEAVNDQDAVALRAMFTDYALAEYSAEIDEGVTQLLSLFPDGDVIWRDRGGPAGSGSGLVGDGKRTWLGGLYDIVSSAGKTYALGLSIFTENTFDPENVGIFRISVDPHTQDQVSGAELASCGSIDSSDARAGAPPGVFIGDSGGLSRDRAAQIVGAINAHDAAALEGMFTRHARSAYPTQIDAGVEYLLSIFPLGDVALHEDTGGSAVCQRIEGDARTVLLPTFYTVTSAGVNYRLYFADFIENSIDPENVGIYAIGAELAEECGRCGPEAELNTWGSEFDLEATARPGIFMSSTYRAGLLMEQIAAALRTHDEAALKAMFSADVLDQTPGLDEGLDYVLSFFTSGDVTWALDPAEINPVYQYSNVEAGKLTERLEGHYKLSVNGHPYWLFFSGTTVDEADTDHVGLASLGVTPWVEDRYSDMPGPPGRFYYWTHEGRYPGIYVP